MSKLLCALDRGLNRLYRWCGYAAAVCMVMIALLVLGSIVTRMLSVYVPGLTEYSGYAMAAGSFLALAYTFGERGHIRVELFLSRLGPTTRRGMEIWCLLVAVITTGWLAWYMMRLVYYSWKFQEKSEGADAILLWKPQALVMVGSIVMAIAILHHFVRCLMHRDYQPH